MAHVLAALVLAWITLRGLYRFRFNESPAGLDLFNRPLAILIQRGKCEEAVHAYENEKTYAPAGDEIKRVSQEDLKPVPPLHNPVLEQHTPGPTVAPSHTPS